MQNKKYKNILLICGLTLFIIVMIILFVYLIFRNNFSYINNNETTNIPKSTVSDENTPENNVTTIDANDDINDDTNNDINDDENINVNNIDNVNINTDTNTDILTEGAQTMEHPDRVTYRAGFYYEPITDDVKKRIYGLSYKEDCTVPYEDLRYVGVLFRNFNGETDYGEIICNKAIAQDLVEIFYELFENDYPIEKIRLVDEYNADDDLSCQDNNTSCFNYRVVAGSTNLSKHALGMAIDINPFYNPYITYPDGIERISPPGSEPYADRDADLPYMIQKGDLCYNLFIERGFTWGGEWKTLKDYQHFQKVLE